MIKGQFAKNLHKAVSERGIKQVELAKVLEVPPTTVNGWMRGAHLPDIEKLMEICDYLEMPVGEMLGDHRHINDLDEVKHLMDVSLKQKAYTEDVWNVCSRGENGGVATYQCKRMSKAVQEKGLDEKSYGGNSALMKAFCDKAVPLCKKTECTFLMINQLRENIGNPYNTDIQSVRQESENADKTVMKRSKSEEKEAEEILEICSKTYAKAEKEGKLDDLEMIRDLIKELGEKGFTAVDSENQVNMTEYEKLIQFSEKAEAKKNGRMTVVEVAKGGSCIIRNMETHDGIVNMIRSYCIYENGKLKQSSEDIYRTESWEYTEDGHLMFSGRLAFEGSYEVTRNEIMEYMAYRVLSLDETCRELNRKYILPIGYERNNMFLTDWSEEEFAELDFYDMFDLFYQENHTANGEFTFGNAMGTSAVYLISKEKFEPVIKSKFKISSEVLQSKTVYYPCEEVYEYKPRGLEETEYPEYPYPEVIGYVNNDDGTLTLKVQAVFPYRGVSKAYIHEVTVRDTKDGGIQYVGNRIIEPINNPEIRWHVPRLTRTEWEELYGDN